MNDSDTIRDLQEALTDSQNYTERLHKRFDKVTTMLEQEKYKAIQVERAQRKHLISLDRMLNKTIDAHEVTKQRLLGYENEAGVPKSASEREAYMSYNPK